MSSNLECRERKRERKRESTRQAGEVQRENRARETFFDGRTTRKSCGGGEKIRLSFSIKVHDRSLITQRSK